jgi:hypothetical protein
MNDDLNPLESERLRRLLAAAAELPREATPPEGAWPAIRRRIDAARVHAIAPGTVAAPERRPARWWPLAAAAALVVVAGSVIVTRREQAPEQPSIAAEPERVPLPAAPDAPATQSPVRALMAVPAGLTANNPTLAAVLEQYQQASRELEVSVATQTAALPPATREVVRRSLATIDAAITDLRQALGSDPRNASLGQYLSAAYEQKLDFLKRVRAMPGAGM